MTPLIVLNINVALSFCRRVIKSSQFNRFKTEETGACIIIEPGNRPGSPIFLSF